MIIIRRKNLQIFATIAVKLLTLRHTASISLKYKRLVFLFYIFGNIKQHIVLTIVTVIRSQSVSIWSTVFVYLWYILFCYF